MDIICVALEQMTLHATSDVVPAVAEAMDQTLARVPGPFDSSAESLAAFSRANYALRLENRRCTESVMADCKGFYFDPHHVYVDPPLEAKLKYDGHALTEGSFVPTSSGMEFSGMESADNGNVGASVSLRQSYTGTVPSSYGLDFVEVRLDSTLHGSPLTVGFQAVGSVALFNVQIW